MQSWWRTGEVGGRRVSGSSRAGRTTAKCDRRRVAEAVKRRRPPCHDDIATASSSHQRSLTELHAPAPDETIVPPSVAPMRYEFHRPRYCTAHCADTQSPQWWQLSIVNVFNFFSATMFSHDATVLLIRQFKTRPLATANRLHVSIRVTVHSFRALDTIPQRDERRDDRNTMTTSRSACYCMLTRDNEWAADIDNTDLYLNLDGLANYFSAFWISATIG